VPEGAWLAPIPKESSLYKGTGAGTGADASPGTGEGNGTTNNTGNGNGANASYAPATDTEGDGGRPWRRAGPDPLLLGGVGAAIVLGVLLGSYALMKRTIGEP
jgi:hypothetical protein